MQLFKILRDGQSCNGGTGDWYSPKGKRPGKWMPKINKLIPCKSGYHLCRKEDLIHWLDQEIYESEYKGDIIIQQDKVVVSQARLIKKLKWDDKTARIFAIKCAKRVLKYWEKEFPQDRRPHEAIKKASLFVLDKTSKEALFVAWSAAADAVWSAADARSAARSAADAAARSAARSAAAAAADADAADDDAARSAARSAAWSAAAAADAADVDAAWSAADAAEREWQTKQLIKLLEIK